MHLFWRKTLLVEDTLTKTDLSIWTCASWDTLLITDCSALECSARWTARVGALLELGPVRTLDLISCRKTFSRSLLISLNFFSYLNMMHHINVSNNDSCYNFVENDYKTGTRNTSSRQKSLVSYRTLAPFRASCRERRRAWRKPSRNLRAIGTACRDPRDSRCRPCSFAGTTCSWRSRGSLTNIASFKVSTSRFVD